MRPSHWECSHRLGAASKGFSPISPPLPLQDEAVRLLAAEHRLLLLPGSAFGAPGTLRLSYGRLVDAQEIEEVATRLADGVRRLLAL